MMQATMFENQDVIEVLLKNDDQTKLPNEFLEMSNLIVKLINEPIDYKKVFFKAKTEAPHMIFNSTRITRESLNEERKKN